MSFISLIYILFLIVFFTIYWKLNNKNWRNFTLLTASYIFYGWWDARFLILIIASSLIDYFCGKKIYNAQLLNKSGKLYLYLSLGFNLGILGLFKYFNFFVDNFYNLLNKIGLLTTDPVFLQILLPVGISFYTFQTLSYTIDIYRQELKPSESLLEFLTFVSFFPQLVAGPIERAKDLLPQFSTIHTFNYSQAVRGSYQIFWGVFKKVAVADPLGIQFVNPIYKNLANATAPEIFIATIAFALQIYCDFSGYSDIAIGTAKLFGFNLSTNFIRPYFSKSPSEFWRRWHISLSSWFRDYVYIPLGGKRNGINYTTRNLLITFSLSGLWHGANWTFIVWGLLNGLSLVPKMIVTQLFSSTSSDELPNKSNNYSLVIRNSFAILTTFSFICLTWIFFRAETVTEAIIAIGHLFTGYEFNEGIIAVKKLIFTLEGRISLLCVFILFWAECTNEISLNQNFKINKICRWAFMTILFCIVIIQSRIMSSEFIYFQF
ncbi:MAG: MBOAT family protein [Pleurocapsa sp.]